MTGAGAGSGADVEDDNVVRFLLASDNHLGVHERDPVRGDDSINTFREILEIARDQNVDFVLLGGDLFHENKPSRETMHRTLSLLREFTLGDRAIAIELLSDPFTDDEPFPTINYEDENINVSIPIFSIHGNHDDPQGAGQRRALSALDLLSASGLINYFGRIELGSEHEPRAGDKRGGGARQSTTLRPILLQKGHTRIALYGMGNVKDERLNYELRANHISMLRPAEEPDSWFNVLTVHQNRVPHNNMAYIPESAFDDSIDLVVWGHEHEQRIMPESVSEKPYHISQPGSSVATSLMPGETVTKRVAIVHVDRRDFLIEPITLRTVRPFVMREIVLATEAASQRIDVQDRAQLLKLLRRHIESLIREANDEWDARQADLPPDARPERMLPIVRLRVLYDSALPLGNVVRFGQEFSGRIANTRDVLQLHLRRARQSRTTAVQIDKDMIPAEKLERISLEKLVEETLATQHLDVLDATGLQRSVMGYINKDDREAIETYVAQALVRFENTQATDGLDDSRMQQDTERVSTGREGVLAAGSPVQVAATTREQVHSNAHALESSPQATPPPAPPTQRRRVQRTPHSSRLAALNITASRSRPR
ncbi:meiotic recombination [Malassezia cuniculi]|uniref:Double-strand break repair protein n=1 Tax=Malassezia cuniculi TaxID=948313 RepID=A0AAF0EWF7_9BASI|nr:meiotic recombination [Malassezia cuniculi]